MKKILTLVLAVFILSTALPALAAKPVDAGDKAELKQARTQERLDAKELKFQERTEAREMRSEKRELRFEEKYNKKTALMVRHFDKKLATFEEHMKDEILLKVYPIFIDKLDRFIERVTEQDLDEELKTERLDYLSALSELIAEELVALDEIIGDDDEDEMDDEDNDDEDEDSDDDDDDEDDDEDETDED